MSWVLVALAYLALASFATWVSWRHSSALVGAALVMCSVVTTTACYGTSFGSRMALEVLQAVVVINTARIAFTTTGCRMCVGVVALAVLDLAFVAMLGLDVIHLRRQVYAYGAVTNAIFVAQCLLVAIPGVRDALVGRRLGRLGGWMVGGGRAAVHGDAHADTRT